MDQSLFSKYNFSFPFHKYLCHSRVFSFVLDLQMAQYAHHPQHYLSTQQSHRLLAYKPPPPPPPQPPSFIPTTSSTNLVPKRPRSPSSHVYSSPSNKSSRSNLVSQMHTSKINIVPSIIDIYCCCRFFFKDHRVRIQHIHHQLVNKLHVVLHQHLLQLKINPLFRLISVI